MSILQTPPAYLRPRLSARLNPADDIVGVFASRIENRLAEALSVGGPHQEQGRAGHSKLQVQIEEPRPGSIVHA